MRQVIHNLRQKPDHHKRAVGLAVAFIATAVVGLVWFTAKQPLAFIFETDDPRVIMVREQEAQKNTTLGSKLLAGVAKSIRGDSKNSNSNKEQDTESQSLISRIRSLFGLEEVTVYSNVNSADVYGDGTGGVVVDENIR